MQRQKVLTFLVYSQTSLYQILSYSIRGMYPRRHVEVFSKHFANSLPGSNFVDLLVFSTGIIESLMPTKTYIFIRNISKWNMAKTILWKPIPWIKNTSHCERPEGTSINSGSTKSLLVLLQVAATTVAEATAGIYIYISRIVHEDKKLAYYSTSDSVEFIFYLFRMWNGDCEPWTLSMKQKLQIERRKVDKMRRSSFPLSP